MQSVLELRYSAWVVFNADGSLEIYIKKIKESQHLFVYTIIISENSPVLFGYFVLARMRPYDFVEKSMQSELWQVNKTIRFYQIMPKRPTLKPGRKRPSRNYPRPECATSAFQLQGSDRWSLLPRRATEPIAASLILNIAISEPLLIT